MKIAAVRNILEATRRTQSGRLIDATALLLRTLHGNATAEPSRTDASAQHDPTIIDVEAEPAGTAGAGTKSSPNMPGGLSGLLHRAAGPGLQPLPGGSARPLPADRHVPVPDGAQFISATFANQAGSRPYKLYVPSRYCGEPVPLIVMLHGCTQSPDDFAAGTRMNDAAEEHVCLVLYPEQTATANSSKCWNWFQVGDQARGRGEPSLIAGITRAVMRDYAVDPKRIYVAGLSAGGAAAAIMGSTYPDLFAAVGVHSGLACGAAHDLPSAFAAMRQGGAGPAGRPNPKRPETCSTPLPAIVFHGDRDSTVNPLNGDSVVAQSMPKIPLRRSIRKGQVPKGHAYSVTEYADATGAVVLEQWLVHGAGHMWSGGSIAGSYTDPRGPDASREMLRFFLQHPASRPI